MAKRPKGTPSGSKGRRDRAAGKAAEKSAAEARERRQTRLILGTSTVIALAAVAIVAFRTLGDDGAGASSDVAAQNPTFAALGEIGTTPFLSGCTREPPAVDPVPEDAEVVEPGTEVDYPMVPPSAGSRLAEPVAVNPEGFYSGADVPEVAALVANLYEGWTVLWFDVESLGQEKVGQIRDAAEVLRGDPALERFVAVEWTPEFQEQYGELPQQVPIALSRWIRNPTGEAGYRALCIEPSGQAFGQFIEFTDQAQPAPAPSGAPTAGATEQPTTATGTAEPTP